MFFYIGDNCPLASLKQAEPKLFLDDGWKYQYGVWYKGYSTECVLKESLSDIISGYKPAGKWCVIHNNKIYHPVLRGFPLYQLENNFTNIKLPNFDKVVYDNLLPESNLDELTIDQASTLIGDILVENTENFYKFNNVPDMTVLVSAGLDTLTAWSIIDKVTKDYKVSVHVPIDTDATLLLYNGTERNYKTDLMDKVSQDYWGYYHACFYQEPNYNITGYYAEVYTYRDGEAINALANYQGKRIDELATENDYLYWFLKRPSIVEKYKNSMLEFDNDEALKRFLWSTIWYDHQMWHLDNNLMFSPFADLRIPNIINRMSVADITKNCVSGEIQKQIIKRFRPDLLTLLSDYKNSKDVWKNFRANFSESMVDPKTKLIYR